MSDKIIEFTIVVNGQPVHVKFGLDHQIGEAVAWALKESGNSGQPADKWELRDDAGHIIDTGKKIGASGIKEGSTLFLNLKAGVGGNRV